MPSYRAGDRVKYRLDAGGYWEAIVIEEHQDRLSPDRKKSTLVYIQVVDSSKSAVPVDDNYKFSAQPERLSKM